MPKNIKIRALNQGDLETVFTLANQLSESATIDKKVLEKNFEKLVIDENHLVLIAESKNSVVGYLSGYFHNTIYANRKTAYIDEIVVSHKKRNNGIGKKLMSEFERISKANNCVLVALATSGAKEFYEKLGYISKASYYKQYLC